MRLADADAFLDDLAGEVMDDLDLAAPGAMHPEQTTPPVRQICAMIRGLLAKIPADPGLDAGTLRGPEQGLLDDPLWRVGDLDSLSDADIDLLSNCIGGLLRRLNAREWKGLGKYRPAVVGAAQRLRVQRDRRIARGWHIPPGAVGPAR